MEKRDEIVKKLLDEDEGFRKTFKTHQDYENKIAKMEKKPTLSPNEKMEKNRLKKLKLALKDEMEKRLSDYRRH
ncbi:MAG TPA: hypothetical protein DDW94_12955 [Deltaproteobacteria bacterium]|nr:MAG: hypothetical protein A2Z79_06820 [Deltaproteobacteria bacterium GWA2_55_82]OGQ63279.1 MAG: hypothetical protein A3I81_00780 [Deltaproteobacteria bacterium RIFCSPLOWO2_02_FULL_55_12]OIJ73114.1 MAG: hypothetical protein A2V21_301845 [Deltaproteobacteria bacterium GWC2_55_46]HBG47880.1 hypothetical protein [Deltaproteobacteria bacterium]HCY11857.1 hypothetical protein [Deltaproteobacteria bacterium]